MNLPSRDDPSRHAAASVNNAAFALYRQLSARENLGFSPLGVYCVLTMLYEGAGGETRQALSGLLHPESQSVAPASLQPLLDGLQSLTRLPGLTEAEVRVLEHAAQVRKHLQERGEWDEMKAQRYGTASVEDLRLQLSIANGIWIQEGYAIHPGFLETVQAIMVADSATVDFAERPAQACEAINAWVTERTHGRISSMLFPRAISPLTRAILGNALSFKARWQTEFHDSKPGAFHLLDGTRVPVQMMVGQLPGVSYVERRDFRAVELPYCRTPLSMVVIVPNRPGKEALVALEQQLAHQWAELAPDAREQYTTAVTLTMPQFTVRGSHRLDAVLGGLGLDTVFGPEADFSGISAEPGFRVGAILHDTYLAVDRYGTEAAAATLLTLLGAADPPRRVVLTIDRPFLFAVLDKSSGVILFLGKVERPE